MIKISQWACENLCCYRKALPVLLNSTLETKGVAKGVTKGVTKGVEKGVTKGVAKGVENCFASESLGAKEDNQ